MGTQEKDDYSKVWRLEVFGEFVKVFVGYLLDYVRAIGIHYETDLYYVKKSVYGIHKK